MPTPTVRAGCLAVLAAAVLLAFEPALRCGWTLYDDPVYVTDNPHVLRGLTAESFAWAFTSVHGGNWHPLTSLSHLLDVTLFGLDPRGPHAVNVVLYASSALLLAWLLFRLSRDWWASLAGAAVFAVHPLRVESVAWISERKDVLSMVLFLLALLAWLRRVESPTAARRATAFALYVLGLLAKPMLVTFPFVLLLLDVWPLGRAGAARWRDLVREKGAYFAASAASCVVTFAVQHAAGAVSGVEDAGLAARAQNAALSYVRYLGATVWPSDLAVCRPFETPASPWPAAFAAAALVVATVLAWRVRARRPALLVGWLWWLGTLVPVIGLVQVGAQSHADRYTYLPTVGLVLAVVFGAVEGARRGLLALALAVACVPLFVATRAQIALWKDTRTLFCHVLAVTEDNAVAEQVYGNALRIDGETGAAIPHLRRAVLLAPGFADAHDALGTALGAQGDLDGAADEFRAALRIERRAGFHHNLGFALTLRGRPDEARQEFERALELDAGHEPSLVKLSEVLASQGRFEDAARAALRGAEAARARGDEATAARLRSSADGYRARRAP